MRAMRRAVLEPHAAQRLPRRLSALGARHVRRHERQLHVCERAHRGQQVVQLEDEADRTAAQHHWAADGADVHVAHPHASPASGWSSPPIRCSSVLLPLPEGPVIETSSPGSTTSETSRSTGAPGSKLGRLRDADAGHPPARSPAH